jgi:hypothetical protein
MKNKLMLAASLLLCSLSLVAKEQVFERSIALADPEKPAKVEVMLMSGSITIEGYKGNKVEVFARTKELQKVEKEKSSKNKDNQSKRGLKRITNDALRLELESRGNSVSVNSINRKQHIDVIVKVPFNSNLELNLMQGDEINISNVKGSIEARNIRGNIKAIGVTGPIIAESMGKELVVVFDNFDTTKPSSLNAHKGNVDVSFPKNSKLIVEVKNYQGEIYSGLDAEFVSTDTIEESGTNNNHRTTIVGGALAATVNGGSQKLMINSFKGDIFIRTN